MLSIQRATLDTEEGKDALPVTMPDLEKLFDKAERNLQKQKFESALEAYHEIYKYQPNNEEVLLNLGDLSLKLNRTAEGLRFQSQLADYYIKRNDTLKAAATCRKILKVSPQDVETLTKLAALLEKSRKTGEALEAYREALELHRKANANQQAMECLQRIVVLDPENLEAHVQLAELATKARQNKVATPAFLQAAQLARQAGQEGRWAEWVERAHSLDPADEAARVAAAEVFLKTDRASAVIPLIEPLVRTKPDDTTLCELLAGAYVSTREYEKAEPLCWKLYQANPDAVDLSVKLVEGLLQSGHAQKALGLLEKMKASLFKQGKRNEFLRIMEKAYEADESNLSVLEELASLYDEMNKEDGLRRSLARLFNLFVGGEQYEKAADTLERIIDVDPYGQGHQDRLLNLEGHIDSVLYNNILSRVQPHSAARAGPGMNTASGTAAQPKAESLDELVIEGEMYLQYQLASKLKETLERMDRLFPGAQERNKRLRELYDAAGFTPTPAPVSTDTPAWGTRIEGAGTVASTPQSLDEVRRISEITARVFRESASQGVMQVAVNEIGRALNVSRCWGTLGTADRPPTLSVEYCAPAAAPSDPAAALKLYGTLMRQAVTSPDGWLIDDAAQSPILAPASAEVTQLGIRSLLALPLIDRDQASGLLLLEQCEAPRNWTHGDSLLLKAIATQVVVAVNNTKLRRLVRSLAGSDEETGLLPRSSYLDCLLAESGRAKESSQPLSVCLLEPENFAGLVKALGERGAQRYFKQVTKALLSNLRQNDIAIRYAPYAIAIIFPDTALPQSGVAVEKVRQTLSQIKPDGAAGCGFCAAVCDVPLGLSFDAVDAVTEVVNRLETAMDQARKEGGKRVLVSKFSG